MQCEITNLSLYYAPTESANCDRSLGLEYASKILASHNRLGMILPKVHHAFNLSACGVDPPSTAPFSGSLTASEEAANIAAALGADVEMHVSPSQGSDASGDGSEARPFATLAAAQDAIRAAFAVGCGQKFQLSRCSLWQTSFS